MITAQQAHCKSHNINDIEKVPSYNFVVTQIPAISALIQEAADKGQCFIKYDLKNIDYTITDLLYLVSVLEEYGYAVRTTEPFGAAIQKHKQKIEISWEFVKSYDVSTIDEEISEDNEELQKVFTAVHKRLHHCDTPEDNHLDFLKKF